MSYRSFKRVLGETNIERKCRFLFGTCLLILISGSFWWYGLQTEKLVYDQSRKAGRDYFDSIMLMYHWTIWNNNSNSRNELTARPGDEGLLHDTIRELQSQSYRWDLLALDDPPAELLIDDKWRKKVIVPAQDSWEYKQLIALRQAMTDQQQLKTESEQASDTDAELLPVDESHALSARQDVEPVFRERWVTEKGDDDSPERTEYHYYQMVHWKQSCLGCHQSLTQYGAFDAALAGLLDQEPPLRVVRIMIPDRETRRKFNSNRAMLATTAIITVVVAMIIMYLIVRYIIVKPLKHLRDVSDQIVQGDMTVRADIQTKDEFEELAIAFNRMLRHLLDAQDELQEVNDDLDGKVDELAQANMQLYEMNRLKGDFLANMSHELRTPLNSILGFSDVLQGIDSLDDKQRRYVQNIRKSGRLLLDMINDTLDLAKMESGKMEVRLAEFPLDAIVTAQCDLVRSLTEEKNIDLELEVGENLPQMYQDQGKVQQILTNLLSNAIKFTPEGGRITVSAQRGERDRLVLSVTDTGVGIADEDRDIIFEKFRQGSTTGNDRLTRSYSGTGLGLSIVKELCKLLGGDVSFTSELGKGSEFTVRLPWTRSSEPKRDSMLANRLEDMTRRRPGDAVSPTASNTATSGATVVPGLTTET